MAMDRFVLCREEDVFLLGCRCVSVAIGAQPLFVDEGRDDATGCWDQDDVGLCSVRQPVARTQRYDWPSAWRLPNAATSLKPARPPVQGVPARTGRSARASGFVFRNGS